MKITKTIPASFLFMMLLVATLALPTLAEAGRSHHRHGHGHGHSHHHHKHSHQHHLSGYNMIHNQPRGYYNRHYYLQPRYSNNYNYYPAAPAYGYPPNVMVGINAGNASFMLRY